MRTHLSLLAIALLLSACSEKKAAPAGAGTGESAPAAAAPKATAPTDPAPAPANPAAPPAAPDASADLESDKKSASDWVSALGKRDAKALAAASRLPFEVQDTYFEMPEKCFKVKTRATTAAELEELTKCLILDKKVAKDAKLIDTEGMADVKPAEPLDVPESPATEALKGKVRWIQISIVGAEQRTFYLGVAEKRVQHVEMFEAPDEH
jgi:hypothetical protein